MQSEKYVILWYLWYCFIIHMLLITKLICHVTKRSAGLLFTSTLKDHHRLEIKSLYSSAITQNRTASNK